MARRSSTGQPMEVAANEEGPALLALAEAQMGLGRIGRLRRWPGGRRPADAAPATLLRALRDVLVLRGHRVGPADRDAARAHLEAGGYLSAKGYVIQPGFGEEG